MHMASMCSEKWPHRITRVYFLRIMCDIFRYTANFQAELA